MDFDFIIHSLSFKIFNCLGSRLYEREDRGNVTLVDVPAMKSAFSGGF